jgi:DNA-binding transcriptional LysR family regulator
LGTVPVIVGNMEAELVHCLTLPPELRAELWLVVREEIKAQPHVRAVADFLAKFVREKLAGASPQP